MEESPMRRLFAASLRAISGIEAVPSLPVRTCEEEPRRVVWRSRSDRHVAPPEVFVSGLRATPSPERRSDRSAVRDDAGDVMGDDPTIGSLRPWNPFVGATVGEIGRSATVRPV